MAAKSQKRSVVDKENVAPTTVQEQPPQRRKPKTYYGKLMSENYAYANFLQPDTRRPLQDLPLSVQKRMEKQQRAAKREQQRTVQPKQVKMKEVKKSVEQKGESSRTNEQAEDVPVAKAGTSVQNSADWKWDSFSFDTAYP